MKADNRSSDPPATRSHRSYRPRLQGLEERCLLAIDLANIAGTAQAGPYGIAEVGNNTSQGVGWSTALLGDTNGDGFQDTLVGAPTIVPNPGGFPTVGNGVNSAAYLVLGSNQANGGNGTPVDWRTLTAPNRIGNIAQVGQTTQNNPTTGNPGFPFNGVVFTANGSPAPILGASVADVGDVNRDGFDDFLIGAPGALDASGANAGTGCAYLVYGSQTLTNQLTNTINLDSPPAGVFVTKFVSSNLRINLAGAHIGASVANAGRFINDGNQYIAIGAPDATISGLAGQGAVFLIPNTVLGTNVTTVFLDEVGQTGGTAGLILAGANSGDAAGFAVANAGNFAGRTNATGPFNDLIIGAPAVPLQGTPATATGPGRAFLVYGQTAATFNSLLQTSGTVRFLPLSQVGQTTATAVPGAVFVGAAAGDLTGYAVSTAGDFNGDGLSDLLIGSPGFNAPAGPLGPGIADLRRARSPAASSRSPGRST